MSRRHWFGMSVALALFVGCSGSSTEKAVQEAKDSANQTVADAREAAADVRDEAAQAASDAKEAAHEAKEAATQAVDAAKTSMKEGLDAVSAKASEALKSVEGGGELLKKVTDLLGSASTSLQGVTDVDTSKAALPKLTELNGSLASLKATIEKLPAEAKTALASVIDKGVEQLEALSKKVEALPGVSDVVKPEVDKLIQGIKDLAK